MTSEQKEDNALVKFGENVTRFKTLNMLCKHRNISPNIKVSEKEFRNGVSLADWNSAVNEGIDQLQTQLNDLQTASRRLESQKLLRFETR